MLYGIDISSNDGDIKLSPLTTTNFVIVKATEGLTYVNPYFKSKCKETLKLNKLLGFYHYGQNNDPEKECQHFINNCLDYLSLGIPILDWEENQSVEWVNKWVRYYHKKTGIWPWIYSNPWRFNNGGVEKNCARWIASYPTENEVGYTKDSNIPKTDGDVICWQYTETGKLDGFKYFLDLNRFYGTKDDWQKYCKKATVENKPISSKPLPTTNKYKPGTYKTIVNNLNVRSGAGLNYRKKSKSQLTTDGKNNSNYLGQLKKGTTVTVSVIKKVNGDYWGEIPSGWICLEYDGKPYVKVK